MFDIINHSAIDRHDLQEDEKGMTLHTFSNIVCLGLERVLNDGEDATEGGMILYSVRHGQLHEE